MNAKKHDDEFNGPLCDERHERLDKDMVDVFARLLKIETRFLVIMTALALNLLGVAASLVY